MSQPFDESLLDFDLDFFHQPSNKTVSTEKFDSNERCRKSISLVKKKIVATDSLIRKYYEKKEELEQLEKALYLSKEDCKKVCIDIQNATEKCTNLENEAQVLRISNEKLLEQCTQSENLVGAIQSHASQLQILVKENETVIEGLKVENQLERANSKDHEKKMLLIQRENEDLKKHIYMMKDIIIGKKKLKKDFKEVLEKYDKEYESDDSDLLLEGIDSEQEPDTEEVIKINDDFMPVKHNLAKSETLGPKSAQASETKSEHDHDSDFSNEQASADTGRGSSLAFSDGEKCLNSPDYFMDHSPSEADIKEDCKKQVSNAATSPIQSLYIIEDPSSSTREQNYTTVLSPIAEMKCTSVDSNIFKSITKSEIESDPKGTNANAIQQVKESGNSKHGELFSNNSVLIDAHIEVNKSSLILHDCNIVNKLETNLNERDKVVLHRNKSKSIFDENECLESNNNEDNDESSRDEEIEMILNRMRFSRPLLTPLPSSPSKSHNSYTLSEPVVTVSCKENQNHDKIKVCKDALKISEENKVLKGQLEILSKDMESIKNILRRNNLLNLQPTDLEVQDLEKDLAIESDYSEEDPILISHDHSIDFEGEVSASECSMLESRIPNDNSLDLIEKTVILSNKKECMANSKPSINLRFEESLPIKNNLHSEYNDFGKNSSQKEKTNFNNSDEQSYRVKQKKLTRLERLRQKCTPKNKIKKVDLPLSHKLRNKTTKFVNSTGVTFLQKKDVSLNNKIAFEKAVKVMSELKCLQDVNKKGYVHSGTSNTNGFSSKGNNKIKEFNINKNSSELQHNNDRIQILDNVLIKDHTKTNHFMQNNAKVSDISDKQRSQSLFDIIPSKTTPINMKVVETDINEIQLGIPKKDYLILKNANVSENVNRQKRQSLFDVHASKTILDNTEAEETEINNIKFIKTMREKDQTTPKIANVPEFSNKQKRHPLCDLLPAETTLRNTELKKPDINDNKLTILKKFQPMLKDPNVIEFSSKQRSHSLCDILSVKPIHNNTEVGEPEINDNKLTMHEKYQPVLKDAKESENSNKRKRHSLFDMHPTKTTANSTDDVEPAINDTKLTMPKKDQSIRKDMKAGDNSRKQKIHSLFNMLPFNTTADSTVVLEPEISNIKLSTPDKDQLFLNDPKLVGNSKERHSLFDVLPIDTTSKNAGVVESKINNIKLLSSLQKNQSKDVKSDTPEQIVHTHGTNSDLHSTLDVETNTVTTCTEIIVEIELDKKEDLQEKKLQQNEEIFNDPVLNSPNSEGGVTQDELDENISGLTLTPPRKVIATRSRMKCQEKNTTSQSPGKIKEFLINSHNETPVTPKSHNFLREGTRKRHNRSLIEKPEIECKRILRSSTMRQLNSDDKVKSIDDNSNSLIKNKIIHEISGVRDKPPESEPIKPNQNSLPGNVVHYEDLDIFDDNGPCANNRQSRDNNINKNANNCGSHPKDSVLYLMLEKYGKKNIKNMSKKIADSTVSKISKNIEKEIAGINELIPNANCSHAMDKFVELVQKWGCKHFMSGLMDFLKSPQRKVEMYNKISSPPAPPMTKTEQVILSLLVHLQKSWPEVDIVNYTLTNMEYVLFKLNRTPEFGTVESISHLYAIICRFFNMKSRLRIFILDAMYCIQFKAVPLIKQCLDVWMHVLPLAHMGIAKSPLVTCMVYLLHFYKCEDRYNRVQEIRNILNRKYHYEITEWNEPKIMEMFRNAIRHVKVISVEVKLLRMALIVIAKRHGPNWCQKNIIKNLLLPIIENESNPERVQTFCVSMLGPLMKPYPVDMKVHCEIIMNMLLDKLNGNPSHQMQESILTSLIYMSRHNYNSVIQTLLCWRPQHISPNFELLMCDFVSEKPLKVWNNTLMRIKFN